MQNYCTLKKVSQITMITQISQIWFFLLSWQIESVYCFLELSTVFQGFTELIDLPKYDRTMVSEDYAKLLYFEKGYSFKIVE